MSIVVDTSVVIDYLRGEEVAARVLERERAAAPLMASEVTRLEVIAGMRSAEEARTRLLLSALIWHPLDGVIAEAAGALGRRWLASHRGIDGADLAVAATTIVTNSRLLTRNVKHFPMFPDLQKPYDLT
ncbi:MAG: type II toxin-antitoxin system VapC family toxin [Ornithinimicrobium sp.]